MTPDRNSVGTGVTPVSEFVRQLRRHLESGFPLGWVQGEICNLVRAGSGHLYFTLKDAEAQLRCAMWRNRAQLMSFQLREGMQVEVRAQITVYEARGEMQLSIEQVRQAGIGNLFEAFMRLKAKLEAEGLFASELKRELPHMPRGIAVVTSIDAAALHDVLVCLRRRAPGVPVWVYPARVQGEGAAAQIAAAITTANLRAPEDACDVLLVCRGGGSIEDLWAFNEEDVVRAIRASRLPVVCGIGHETDTTLADFAADARAATPTAAAELASAGLYALRTHLPHLANALTDAASTLIAQRAQRLDIAERRLVHPQQRLARSHAQLDQLALRLRHDMHIRQQALRRQLDALEARMQRRAPGFAARLLALENLQARMRSAIQRTHVQNANHVHVLGEALEHLNPQAVLQRGYAIVRDAQGGIVRDANTLQADDPVEIVLAEGRADARVVTTRA